MPVGRRTGGSTVLGLGALVVLAGAGTAYATVSAPGPRYRLATVTPAQVSAAIDVVGTLSPVQQADVPFPVSGTVATVAVRSGQRVTAGQRLGSLSKASLRAALAAAQSTLDQANLQVSHDIAGQDQAARRPGSGSGAGSGSGSGSAGGSASAALRPLQQAVLRAQHRADQALARARAALAQAGQVCTSPAPSPSGTPSPSRTPVPGSTPSAGATPSPRWDAVAGRDAVARPRVDALPRRPPRRPRRAPVRTPPSRCWRPRPWYCTPSRHCPGSCPRSARRWPRRSGAPGRTGAADPAAGVVQRGRLVRAGQRGPAGRRPGHVRCRRGAAHRRAAEPGQRHCAQPDQRHRGQRGGQPGHGGRRGQHRVRDRRAGQLSGADRGPGDRPARAQGGPAGQRAGGRAGQPAHRLGDLDRADPGHQQFAGDLPGHDRPGRAARRAAPGRFRQRHHQHRAQPWGQRADLGGALRQARRHGHRVRGGPGPHRQGDRRDEGAAADPDHGRPAAGQQVVLAVLGKPLPSGNQNQGPGFGPGGGAVVLGP